MTVGPRLAVLFCLFLATSFVAAQTSSATSCGFSSGCERRSRSGLNRRRQERRSQAKHARAVTDSDGEFTVPNLPPGNYEASISPYALSVAPADGY